jgi:hypothetical protein
VLVPVHLSRSAGQRCVLGRYLFLFPRLRRQESESQKLEDSARPSVTRPPVSPIINDLAICIRVIIIVLRCTIFEDDWTKNTDYRPYVSLQDKVFSIPDLNLRFHALSKQSQLDSKSAAQAGLVISSISTAHLASGLCPLIQRGVRGSVY